MQSPLKSFLERAFVDLAFVGFALLSQTFSCTAALTAIH